MSAPDPKVAAETPSSRFGPAYAALAAQLRAERERQGLTQRELGRRIEEYSTSLCNWEKGRSVPGIAATAKWAAGLGLKLALVRSEPDEQQPAEATGGEQTQPWPRAQRMPLAVVGGRPQPWHHQAIAEYGAATGTELKSNPTILGGYTATQVNWAITWWNERVEAEQVQDGAAGRVEAWVNRIAAHASDETDTRRIADFRAVLAERNALASRVAELTAEREPDARAVNCLLRLVEADPAFSYGPAATALRARFADRIAALDTTETEEP